MTRRKFTEAAALIAEGICPEHDLPLVRDGDLGRCPGPGHPHGWRVFRRGRETIVEEVVIIGSSVRTKADPE